MISVENFIRCDPERVQIENGEKMKHPSTGCSALLSVLDFQWWRDGVDDE